MFTKSLLKTISKLLSEKIKDIKDGYQNRKNQWHVLPARLLKNYPPRRDFCQFIIEKDSLKKSQNHP